MLFILVTRPTRRFATLYLDLVWLAVKLLTFIWLCFTFTPLIWGCYCALCILYVHLCMMMAFGKRQTIQNTNVVVLFCRFRVCTKLLLFCSFILVVRGLTD